MDFYHVLNRGVEKRNIVMNDNDRMRFVRSLYIFNDSAPAENAITQKNKRGAEPKKRDLLIHIHAWCLMDNHYHLLLSPVENDPTNLSFFMKKLNGGYAKFFNEKYNRNGCLWQGKYKKILINSDNQFQYIPYYIHLNALDYTMKQWRDGGITDIKKAISKLNDYRWSSFLDYVNRQNFPSIITKSILGNILKTEQNQHQYISSIIQNRKLSTNAQRLET